MRKYASKSVKVFLIVFVLISFFSSTAYATNSGFQQNYGQIKRLYITHGKSIFALGGGMTAMNPKYGYYSIPADHSNYQSLIDLLYLAAERRWVVKVKTKETLDSFGFAVVNYLVVDF